MPSRVDVQGAYSKALRAIPDKQFWYDAADNAGGLGDAALALGTGLVAQAGTGLGVGAGMARDFGREVGGVLGAKDLSGMVEAGKHGPKLDAAAEGIGENVERFTYAPKSKGGQGLQRGLGEVMQPLETGMRRAGDVAADVTGSPAAGAAVYTGLNFLDPELLAPGAAKIAALRGASKMARGAEFEPVSSTGWGGKQRGAWSPGKITGTPEPVQKSLIDHASDPNISDDDFIRMAQQDLQPGEIAALSTPGRRQNFRQAFVEATALSPDVLGPAALAGRAKRGWYERSAKVLRDVFGDDTEKFVGLLASMSPQVSVETNLLNALNVWSNWKAAGMPSDPAAIKEIMGRSVQQGAAAQSGGSSVLPAWEPNSIRSLMESFSAKEPRPRLTLADLPDLHELSQLSGPKVEAFRRALLGDLDQVVNDTWQGVATGQDQTLFGGQGLEKSTRRRIGLPEKGESFNVANPEYLSTNAATRETARLLNTLPDEANWKPSEIQETVWSLTKTAVEKAEREGIPISEALKQLTQRDLSETVDFANLLQNPKYGDVLRGSGYGTQLDALKDQAANLPAVSGGGSIIVPGLEGFERQLHNSFLQRNYPGEFRQARADAARGASDVGGGLYTRRSGGMGEHSLAVADALRRHGSAVHSPSMPMQDLLRRFDLPATNYIELAPNDLEAANFFREQMLLNKQHAGKKAASVAVYSPEEYAQMQLMSDPTGGSLFALKPTETGKDVVSVINERKRSQKQGTTPGALALAMQQGGNTLDAFDTVLPNLYGLSGFHEAGRVAFDPHPNVRPADWDFDAMRRFNQGKPDLVFMGLPQWEVGPRGVRPKEPNAPAVGPARYTREQEKRRNAGYAGGAQAQSRLVQGTSQERAALQRALLKRK